MGSGMKKRKKENGYEKMGKKEHKKNIKA